MIVAAITLVLLGTFASAYNVNDCPRGVRDRYTEVYGDKCYRFVVFGRAEYSTAQNYCKKRGGSLALVKSKFINTFIKGRLRYIYYGYRGPAWIGLNDIEEEGTFKWVDGTSMRYSNFGTDEGPRSGVQHYFEDCVAIDSGSFGEWRDYRCSDAFLGLYDAKKPFVCEFPVTIRATTPSPQTSAPETTQVPQTTAEDTPSAPETTQVPQTTAEDTPSAPETTQEPQTTAEDTPSAPETTEVSQTTAEDTPSASETTQEPQTTAEDTPLAPETTQEPQTTAEDTPSAPETTQEPQTTAEDTPSAPETTQEPQTTAEDTPSAPETTQEPQTTAEETPSAPETTEVSQTTAEDTPSAPETTQVLQNTS